jgi:exopolysaccharide biosynthesis predicted pyruvyltransferase EpsI
MCNTRDSPLLQKVSYKFLDSLGLSSNILIHLSNDLSLYLTKSDLANFIDVQSKFESGSYDLLDVRTDKESLIPKTYFIKKLKGHRLLINDISVSTNFKNFVNAIEYAQNVYTDRLHVAILASIFGKKTFLFPNLYFKNESVYENSLRERFLNLRFVRDLDNFEIND